MSEQGTLFERRCPGCASAIVRDGIDSYREGYQNCGVTEKRWWELMIEQCEETEEGYDVPEDGIVI